MPRLPALPPRSRWRTIWPRTIIRYSMDRTNREFVGRTLLVNTRLADEFTRALRIRSNEVIIEAFPGPGILTRSLLSGGVDTDFEGIESSDHQRPAQAIEEREGGYKKPALVVACEPSPRLLLHLGLDENDLPDEIPPQSDSDQYVIFKSKVYQSKDEERLLLSPSTPYRWPTLSQLLGNKLVERRMEKWSEGEGESESEGHGEGTAKSVGEGANDESYINQGTGTTIVTPTQRPWEAPPPHITVVAQMPVSVSGDQMVSQWVGSAAGMPGEARNWIWKWGRLRLALLVGKTQYDRMMAGPGETIHCKLSIMTQALFHITPLPPYHHVFNVDKSSTRTESSPIRGPPPKNQTKSALGLRASQEIPAPPPLHEPHTTYADDFHPVQHGMAKHLDIPLPRPELLGVLLEPRKESPITLKNKEEWDYVLRKCFVTEAQELGRSLKNLAFGAEGLMEKIEDGLGEITERNEMGAVGAALYGSGKSADSDDEPIYKSKWKGKATPGHRIIRDMSVEEWTRVVDVFTRWAFKPTNLMLDNRPGEDIRQIGQD